jgi:hypothetical protein
MLYHACICTHWQNFERKFIIFIVIKNKFVMHKCSPAVQEVLPVATGCAIHCPPHADIITVEAHGICDHVTVYVSFTYQSTVLPRKTPMQN